MPQPQLPNTNFDADSVGNSDEEFSSEPENTRYRFYSSEPLKPAAMTILTKGGPIKGLSLIQLGYKVLGPFINSFVPNTSQIPYKDFLGGMQQRKNPDGTTEIAINFIPYMQLDMTNAYLEFRGQRYCVQSDTKKNAGDRVLVLKKSSETKILKIYWLDCRLTIDEEVIDCEKEDILLINPSEFYPINQGLDWFKVLGTMAECPTRIDVSHRKRPRSPSEEHLFFCSGPTQAALKLEFKKKTERLSLIDHRMSDRWHKDFSYQEISDLLARHPENFTEKYSAQRQLALLKGGKPQIVGDIFHDFLNALMFGVEASRNNLSLLTGLMTLELIANDKMTYQEAFSQFDCQYPMASHNGGPGKYRERRESIEQVQAGSSPSLKTQRQNPHRHEVTLKEAIIIKNWLKMKNVISNSRQLSKDRMLLDIETAYHKLLCDYFLIIPEESLTPEIH